MHEKKLNWKNIVIIILACLFLIIIGVVLFGQKISQEISKISCNSKGGEFYEEYTPYGIVNISCHIPAKDAGKVCVYNDECESGSCRYEVQ